MSHPEQPTDKELTASASTRWGDAAWLASVSSILGLALLPFSSYIASAPFIREEWGMSNAQAAFVFSAYLVGYAVSSLGLVPLADRLSPRRVLIASVFVMAASNLLFPLLATGVWSGSLLRFLAGMGHVGAYITGIQLVSLRFAGGKRGTAVGVFVGAGYAGPTVSFVFMGQLLRHISSWQTAYLVTALVGLVSVAPALLLARDRNAGQPNTEQARGGAWRLDLSILRDRSVALVILGYALHTAELYLARLWLPLLLGAMLIRDGTPPVEAAALAATWAGLMFMTGIGGAFIGGLVSDYVGRTAGAMIIFAVSGACSFAVGWLVGAPPAILIALGFLYGFATAADSAIYITAVSELSPRGRIGSTQAIQAFIGFTMGAIAPIAAGSILDMAKGPVGWGLAFSLNGALAVTGVILLFALRRMPSAARMAGGKR